MIYAFLPRRKEAPKEGGLGLGLLCSRGIVRTRTAPGTEGALVRSRAPSTGWASAGTMGGALCP